MKKLFENRYYTAVSFILFSVGMSLLLGLLFGGLFCLLNDEVAFVKGMLRASTICFLWFAAGIAVAGILLLITNIPIDLAGGFGYGLYYGTIFVAAFIKKLGDISESNSYALAFIFTALVCYIVWLKAFKSKYTDDD